MLVSMTGFGSSSFEDSNLSINIELKSFNSRYFELNTKSFDLSGPLEYKIRNYLKKQLFRGSVTLIVKVDSKDSFNVNPKLARMRTPNKRTNIRVLSSLIFII